MGRRVNSLCDATLQSGALREWRRGPRRGWAKRVLGGAMCTRCGIDRPICQPTEQQNRPLTASPHRVGNRPSVTGATSPPANPRSSVPSTTTLAKGWNRPLGRPGRFWACVVNRTVTDARHGVTSGRQVYLGGIDRDHRFLMAPASADSRPKATRRVGEQGRDNSWPILNEIGNVHVERQHRIPKNQHRITESSKKASRTLGWLQDMPIPPADLRGSGARRVSSGV